jgi:hypothetical protein
MTHSTINTERENAGSVDVALHTIDITSLDSAGAETFDPDAEVGLSDASEYGVAVRGQENPGYQIVWDHINEQLAVKYADYDAASDGVLIDVPNNTDVGEVVLEITGV